MAVGSAIRKGILPTSLCRAKTVTATKKEVKSAEAKNTTVASFARFNFAILITGTGSTNAGATL